MNNENDLRFMKRAFALARRGAGRTSPNPMVGAVLVRGEKIIGEGWHKKRGAAHAEEAAILDAKSKGFDAAGAALYCTLEPCSFEAPDKLRPPCTRLIIQNRIARAVIAAADPNPRVNGGGIAALKNAGIAVQTGVLAHLDEELNRGFRAFWRHGRPFVHIKLASSLDGRIAAAAGDSKWISCEVSRRQVHKWRAFYDAVLVGHGCWTADKPELTVRLVRGRNPMRVVLASALMIDGERVDIERDKTGLPLKEVLRILGERGVRSVLVEGGSKTAGSFLRQGLWDRLSVFFAPRILGEGLGAVSGFAPKLVSEGIALGALKTRRSGSDILIEVDNVYRDS